MQEAGARRLERVRCTLRSRQQNRSNEDGGGEGGEEDGEGGRGQGGGSRAVVEAEEHAAVVRTIRLARHRK